MTEDQEPHEGQKPVYQKHLKSKLVTVEQLLREDVENVADYRGTDGYPRRNPVIDMQFGEKAKGIETEQRPIGCLLYTSDAADE